MVSSDCFQMVKGRLRIDDTSPPVENSAWKIYPQLLPAALREHNGTLF
jgi:hypothetical protein